MSHLQHNIHASNDIEYDRLPLEGHELAQDIPYNLPPSSIPGSPGSRVQPFYTPNEGHRELPGGNYGLPPGAALPHPRFLGAAAYSDGPNPRDSYASSHNTYVNGSGSSSYAPSLANDSVYALNYGRSTTPTVRDSFTGSYRDDPRGQYSEQVPIDSLSKSHGAYLADKRNTYIAPRQKSKRRGLFWGVIASLILIVAIVAVLIYFLVVRKHNGDSSSSDDSTGGNNSTSTPPQSTIAKSGGNGSNVTTTDGTTFVYSNNFGGYWYWDENDPFNDGAKPNSWTPALNETFNYGVDRIWGVNIGGWLTLEPFITPALYEQYLSNPTPPVDEWTLSQAMAGDTANGGLAQQMENHYKTFITEEDFAQIAGAGLNFVRIPLPYWAIETRGDEPFLPKVAWTYFLKAIQWARKYGLRINLDFHALPGSQNGWNHSGKLGTVNVLYGPMGLANAQRSLDYIRILAEFISQPQYKDVVAIFGVTNEPQGPNIGQENLERYYFQAYNNVRTASGVGQGNGPFISLHEGFMGLANWAGYLPNADRVAIDIHPYLCFGGQSAAPMASYAETPCNAWGSNQNKSMKNFGLTGAGEWSNAVTDCGLWVNGVGLGTRYESNYTPGVWPRVGSCDTWTNWQAYNASLKSDIMTFAEASMDALQNWFFWTWKIGNSSVSGVVESPAWSYSLGLQEGWMPADPRSAVGACGNADPWDGPLLAWQTGGAGAGQIAASASAAYAWPPTTILNGGPATDLPSYTPTGTVATLPPPTFTATGSATSSVSFSVGNGWLNPSDTASGMVAIATCSYLDPWIGSADPPSPLCSGAAKRDTLAPRITPPPSP